MSRALKIMQAMFELEQDMQVLQAGVFGAVRTQLQARYTHFTDALTTWDTEGTAVEDADLAYRQARVVQS